MGFGSVKGSRLEENTVRVMQLKNGQFMCTFPKRMAKNIKLEKGSIISFESWLTEFVLVKKVK